MTATATHPFALVPPLVAFKRHSSDMCDEQTMEHVLLPWARSIAGSTEGDACVFASALASFISDERRQGMPEEIALALIASTCEAYEEDPARAAAMLAEALDQERTQV
jgi:hypothetical protein